MTPTRAVHQHDALRWLAEHPASRGTSVITSLPDVSEMRGLDFEGWRDWFSRAVGAVLGWVPPDGVAVFFQTDVLHRGIWIDKSHLVESAAERSDAVLVWHKIVCRTAPGTIQRGRPGYSHLLCFSPKLRPAFRHPLPDVLPDAGAEGSRKAMGIRACELACRYVLEATKARLVVDPFCGGGSVLAVANALGLDALGVDISARCCRAARQLTVRLPDAG